MKYSLAVAALLGVSSGIKLRGDPVPWLKDTLPECPTDKKRTIMDDGKTHIAKYPFVGATCRIQVQEQGVTLIQLGKETAEGIDIGAPVAAAAPKESTEGIDIGAPAAAAAPKESA